MASYSGVVYDVCHPPDHPDYFLSNDQLSSLATQFNGVPIKMEHNSNNVIEGTSARVYGTCESASFDGRQLRVHWKPAADERGITAEYLIHRGDVPELSLLHSLYSDGSVRPREVSLVQKGMRGGCSIDVKQYKPRSCTPPKVIQTVMASAASTPVIEAVAPAAPAPDVAAYAAATAVVEEANKRARDEATGRFTAPAGVAEPEAKRARPDPGSFLNNLKGRITDEATLQEIANFIADEFEEKTLTQAEVRTLTEAKQKLEEAQIAHVAGKQDEAKNIVDTLHNLYTNYGNNSSLQEEHQKASLSEWLSANPSALKALTPIVVAASGIYKRTADAAIANGSRALDGALAKIELMNKQNAAARNMYPTAHPVVPQVQPNWQSATVPVADVAATGARQEAPKFRMPAIFSTGMASFNESGGVGRVVQSQYDRNLNSHQGRA